MVGTNLSTSSLLIVANAKHSVIPLTANRRTKTQYHRSKAGPEYTTTIDLLWRQETNRDQLKTAPSSHSDTIYMYNVYLIIRVSNTVLNDTHTTHINMYTGITINRRIEKF